MLVRWHADGPDSQAFKDHVNRIPDYLWYVNAWGALLCHLLLNCYSLSFFFFFQGLELME